MDNKKITDAFKEGCREAITAFEDTLHNYDYEKSGDFHQYAIGAARAAKVDVCGRHYQMIMTAHPLELDTLKEILSILNDAYEAIDNDMHYTKSYYEFVDYLYTERNNLEHA